MLESKQITPEGLNWLTLATDPFHDTALSPAGYPDMNTCNSLVQCFTFTQSVASNLGSSALWDAQVVFNPLSNVTIPVGGYASGLQPITYQPNTGLVVGAPTPNPIIFGGYNVLTGPTGFDWSIPSTSITNAAQSLAYPVTGAAGQFRLIGAGVEVVNTTPDLYRGGSVTVYRSPSTAQERNAYVWTNVPTANGYALNVNGYSLPPTTQAGAQLYPTSKTWGAEEGCYCTATMSTTENFFLTPAINMPFWWSPPSNVTLTTGGTSTAYSFLPAIAASQTGATSTTAQVLPYDTHGAIFTGLNPNTTLQVTTKYFIERIPTITEPDLLVLTRAPSPFDPMALELYTRTIQQLAVGVMVKENPLGEWFSEVLDTVAEWAPRIGNAVGGPASIIGNVVGQGARAIRNVQRNTGPSIPAAIVPKRKRNARQSQTGVMSGAPKQTYVGRVIAQPATRIATRTRRPRRRGKNTIT
jgi:hypothetical protein